MRTCPLVSLLVTKREMPSVACRYDEQTVVQVRSRPSWQIRARSRGCVALTRTAVHCGGRPAILLGRASSRPAFDRCVAPCAREVVCPDELRVPVTERRVPLELPWSAMGGLLLALGGVERQDFATFWQDGRMPEERAGHEASRSRLAAMRSAVARPSVNHPRHDPTRSRAGVLRPVRCQSRARLVVARSSSERAP